MGLYSSYIFPRLLDWSLGNAIIQDQRREALAPLHGHVLEIGFGTGLNLACYPPHVTRLTVIDSESMLPERIADRIARVQVPVKQMQLDAGERLPFEDNVFDGVVTTFTLCSIANVDSAIEGIRRVLKPEGDYAFLEHGRSANPKVATRQDFFNPLQKIIGRGCNMNRPIDTLIRAAGLRITKLDRYVMPDTPQILGEMYQGIAQKCDARDDAAKK